MRILLDTNVWRYLEDFGWVNQFQTLVRRSHVDVLVPPAVVYEQLRLPDPVGRRRAVEATTRLTWVRLMPELWTLCEETIGLVRKHKADWLLAKPDPHLLTRRRENELDWKRPKGGFWERSRRVPEQQARWIDSASPMTVPEFEAKLRRVADEVGQLSGLSPDTVDLSLPNIRDTSVFFSDELQFTMPRWAFEAASHIHSQWIVDRRASYCDWLESVIDRAQASHFYDWCRLWELADPEDAPTLWAVWAGKVTAAVGRINGGTAVDIQMFGYLPRVDLFVTADKRLARAVRQVGSHAPIPMAVAHLVSPDSIVESLAELISRPGEPQG